MGFRPQLGPATGDPQLIDAVRTALNNTGPSMVSAVYAGPSGVKYASFGCSPQTQFQLASLTKGYTGDLMACAIEDGLLAENTRVQDLIPECAGWTVGTVTLVELATHRSGLDANGSTNMTGAAFTGFSRAQVISYAQSRHNTSRRGTYLYSNLGFALLGHAIAAARGVSYASLFASHISDVGAPSTTLTLNTEGYGPAMAAVSSAEGLGVYMQYLLDCEDAQFFPRYRIDGDTEIGLAWRDETRLGRVYVSKDGLISGWASVMWLDRAAGSGVTLMQNSSTQLGEEGLQVLRAFS